LSILTAAIVYVPVLTRTQDSFIRAPLLFHGERDAVQIVKVTGLAGHWSANEVAFHVVEFVLTKRLNFLSDQLHRHPAVIDFLSLNNSASVHGLNVGYERLRLLCAVLSSSR